MPVSVRFIPVPPPAEGPLLFFQPMGRPSGVWILPVTLTQLRSADNTAEG